MTFKWISFFLFLTISFFQIENVLAQEKTQVRQFIINKNEANTEYAFTVAHITDIHIGEGEHDFGSPGFVHDTMPEGISGYPQKSLSGVVDWINANKDEEDIRFVAVTGDITGSAEESEFRKAKEILDRLQIPYVPLLGNHDIWPYINYGNEAEYAYGDSIMLAVFEDNFQANKLFFDKWSDGTRLTKTYNEESGHYHQLVNYSFVYNGFTFIVLDWNPRYHVKKAEPGIGPEPSLHDYEGGTLPWLIENLKNPLEEGEKNIILFTHHPPQRDISAIFNFGFTVSQFQQLSQEILPYKNKTSAWLAGHVHRSSTYTMRTMGSEIKLMDVRETGSNKEYENGLVTLVRFNKVKPVPTGVKQNQLNNAIDIYPNPTTDYLNISNTDLLQFHTVEIYNMSGMKVFATNLLGVGQSNIQIDISGLQQGVYMLQLKSENAVSNKKFVKLYQF